MQCQSSYVQKFLSVGPGKMLNGKRIFYNYSQSNFIFLFVMPISINLPVYLIIINCKVMI